MTLCATSSPFSPEALARTRQEWGKVAGCRDDLVECVRGYQHFHLDLIGAMLEAVGDPDWRQAATSPQSFKTGIPAGVGLRLPRTPAVYERKRKWRSLDETNFQRDTENY